MEKNKKVVFLVLSSNNTINVIDEQAQRITWGIDFWESIYWLKGSLLDETRFEPDRRQIIVSTEEIQRNILEKTTLGIKWLLENREFDLLIRTNVSTYFSSVPKKAINEIADNSMPKFGGYLEQHQVNFGLQAKDRLFVSGAGIFLNRKACEVLLECPTDLYEEIPDDLAISHFLRYRGAFMTSIKRGNIHATGIFVPSAYMRLKSSLDTSVTEMRMKNIHHFFTARSFFRKILLWLKVQWIEVDYAIKSRERRQELRKNFRGTKKLFFLNHIQRIFSHQGFLND